MHFRISTTSSGNEGGDTHTHLTRNVWAHIVYMKTGGRLELWIEGIQDGASFWLAGTSEGNDGPFYIGGDPWYDNFNGLMANF
jgi:hypothetical protein